MLNPTPRIPLSTPAAAAPIKSMSLGNIPAAAAPNESMIIFSMGVAAAGVQENAST